MSEATAAPRRVGATPESASPPPAPPSDGEPPEPKGIGKTTLGKYGMKMPLGMTAPDGSVAKNFVVKPWTMAEEKELAQAKKDDPGQNIATYVSTVVAWMCSQLGPHTFTPKTSLAERRVYVSQMYMADVWYIYAYLRRETLGDILKLNLSCPRCNDEFPWAGSLASLGVHTAPNLDACMWDYELAHPVSIRGSKVVKFKVGPQRWQVAEAIFGDPNEGDAKDAALRASIYCLNDSADRIQLLAGDLDVLTKKDIEGLSGKIDEHFIGPDMSIEIGEENPCKSCGFNKKRRLPIDWSYDNFFGTSSH